MAAIDLRDVTKSYGRTRALDALTMTVRDGSVHGFLGPNGAGKSTTIRVLLGLARPDSGEARLLGGDPVADAAALHRRLAYVPGDVSLWPGLTGGECLDVLARLRGGVEKARQAELIEAFALDPRKKAGTYSKGNRQKVALVAALAADVELYLLDEPTSGLDPLMERVFTEQVRALADEGRTVLLSSHILSEVEALCDEVSIIKAGRLVASGTLADLRHLHVTQLDAHLPDPAPDLAALPGVSHVETSPGRGRLDVSDDGLAGVLAALAAAGATGLTSAPPSLEELFVRHYEVDGVSERDDVATRTRWATSTAPVVEPDEGAR